MLYFVYSQQCLFLNFMFQFECMSTWVHECIFTHFFMYALSNHLLHRVLNFAICKAYYGVLTVSVFSSSNCLIVFSIYSRYFWCYWDTEYKFSEWSDKFYKFYVILKRMIYSHSLGLSEYSTIGNFKKF